MWYVAVGLAAVYLTHAGQQSPPGAVALQIVKAKMAENLGRLPNYTCSQTTERFRRVTAGSGYEPVDTVHLEVALVDGRELYGWPGSNNLSEPNLTNLIGGAGALSNGSFALLAKRIFLSPATSFSPRGSVVQGKERALKFDYAVPVEASDYHLRIDGADALVGYHGSFWVDAKTLDLTRLHIFADHIPPQFPLASASDAMEYARVKIGSSNFLLPASAELNMTTASGLADRNRTRFHECHQYAGESVVSFGAPPVVPDLPAPVRPAEILLPADFQVDLALETPITPSSAVGDAVQARLLRHISDHHRIVASKGAILTGRVTELHRDPYWYHLGISFTDVAATEGHASLTGRENILFGGAGPRELHLSATLHRMEHGFRRNSALGTGDLAIPKDMPLNLKSGFRITLRSRLLQSGK